MRRVSTCTVLAASILGAAVAQASVATFLGTDAVTGANWRTPGAKPYANAGGVYGGDGYYMLSSTLPLGDWGAGPGHVLHNNLPAYISSSIRTPNKAVYGGVFGINGGDWYGGGINDPSAAVQPTNTPPCSWVMSSGANQGNNESLLFTITLASPATFQLGVIHNLDLPDVGHLRVYAGIPVQDDGDPYDDAGLTPLTDLIAIDQTGASVDRNFEKPRYSFFQLSGNAGDSFTVTVEGWFSTPSQVFTGSAGLTFDAVPEPGSLAFLGMAAALLVRRRSTR